MSAYSNRLAAVTKELWTHWQETREYWQDARAIEFEQQYLSELLSSVDRSVFAMEELDKLLTKIRKDCE
jgi:hypothetical protein